MKIFIPIDEISGEICVSFGRTPYFLVVDTDANSSEMVENIYANEESGVGVKSAQLVVDNGGEIVITKRCGENSAEILKLAEIEIYKSSGKNPAENVELFKAGKLEKLDHFHAGFVGKG